MKGPEGSEAAQLFSACSFKKNENESKKIEYSFINEL
jgi:hypothetical protein